MTPPRLPCHVGILPAQLYCILCKFTVECIWLCKAYPKIAALAARIIA